MLCCGFQNIAVFGLKKKKKKISYQEIVLLPVSCGGFLSHSLAADFTGLSINTSLHEQMLNFFLLLIEIVHMTWHIKILKKNEDFSCFCPRPFSLFLCLTLMPRLHLVLVQTRNWCAESNFTTQRVIKQVCLLRRRVQGGSLLLTCTPSHEACPYLLQSLSK